MKDGREKGNRFENDVCRPLSNWLGPAKKGNYDKCPVRDLAFRRATTSITPSSGQWEGRGDILHIARAGIVFPFCVECKNVEGWELDGLMYRSRVDPWEWWEQAKGQAKGNGYPFLVFTRNHRPVYTLLETKVTQCLKLLPKNGPVMSLVTPRGQEVTLSLLSDVVRTSKKLVARLAAVCV